jgi:hypothetical protein
VIEDAPEYVSEDGAVELPDKGGASVTGEIVPAAPDISESAE